jgi:hypothetical protein
MYNLDDHNLDQLSREAAEQYELPGTPSWEAMAQRLDKELPLKKDKRRRGFIFFLILAGLITAGGGLWWYTRHGAGGGAPVSAGAENKAITAETPTPPANESNPATSATIRDTRKKGDKKTVLSTTIVSHNHEIADPASSNDFRPAASQHKKQNSLHQPNKPLYANRQSLANKAAIRQLSSAITSVTVAKHPATNAKKSKLDNGANHPADIAVNDNTTGNQAPINDSAADPDIDSGSSKASGLPQGADTNPAATSGIADTGARNSLAANTGTVKATDKKKQSSAKNWAISLALTAGMDLSTVKFTYRSNSGYNIGITGAYHFNSRWSVQTGVLYTKKNYKLNGSDYNPPKHYWTQYVDLQTVEGYCRMWEVPVLARYTFPSGSSRHFFVSTGLSSYFMKKESYDYYYMQNNTPYDRQWTNNTHLIHWFSILHLSAGVEKQLNRHLALEMQPYAKLPLGGVGFGAIRLSSFGINFSLRYRQPVKP